RTADVAARSLRNRLGAVLQVLPLAARKAEEDIEYVHQLRVWTRRACAALDLYEELLPRRRCAWLKKQLKRVRRAANDARDCDVLIERLKTERSYQAAGLWLEELRAERSEKQKAIVTAERRLSRGHRFLRRSEKLMKRLQSRDEKSGGAAPSSFGDWAPDRLRPLVEHFLAAVPADRTDNSALHQFRIRGKQVRYAMELLAGAFSEEFRTKLYPVIEAMQGRLGEINDLATSIDRLTRKLDASADSAGEKSWQLLLARHRALLEEARQVFWDWFDSQQLQELRKGFERELGRVTQTADPPSRPLPATSEVTHRASEPLTQPLSVCVTQPLPNGSPSPPSCDTMTKARIVGELGETQLLLPAQVSEALAANDRAKYLMTLLQVAREHADHPDLATTDLRQERLACGVEDAELDTVVARSLKEGTDAYVVPSARRILDRLVENVRQMMTPLRLQAGSAQLGGERLGDPYEERVVRLLSQAPALGDDRITGEYLDRLTTGRRENGDSLHLVVMDLHQELNRLQRQLATETINGARVYSVDDDDRPLIVAFMEGVHQTEGLKFDHPGLGTTATHSGDRLVIQNDIGLTEAHVLVVHIAQQKVSVTYTDVHIDRLVFFQNLFDRFAVRWDDTVSRRTEGLREDLYHMCLGTYVARDRADLLAYLSFLGSRLVFLIDWNRARKRLRKFAPRRVCSAVLRWAADQNYGHRGFLSLGGEQLIFDALQSAGRLPIPPGGQLSDVLGAERTAEFLKFTLQTATEGLQAGRSEFLIRDEVTAELRHYIDTVHQGLLEVAAEHASLVVELAFAARDMLLSIGSARDRDVIQRAVLRARKWEHRADELVNRCRAARSRGDAPGPVLDLLVTADDSADGLEEAIYWMSLLPEDVAAGMPVPLNDLAGLALQGAQEYLKAVENARRLHRGSPREQVADFLEAVDRTLTVEHQTDEAHRHAQAGVLSFAGDYKQWHLVHGIADNLEEVADALLRSAMVLRDYILGEVLRR
ncbi:MAG: CHAD domain-containing protein, partial [Planctomycetaceae bacterium]|nr:CHAD domain-containing protein [Planctomycetaceae bacterium]